MSLQVWQIDPAHLTPYYDAALSNALSSAGCRVRLLASPFLYDPALPAPTKYELDNLYFPNLPSLRHFAKLRRLLRMLLYPLGHQRVIHQLAADRPNVVHLQWSRVPKLDLWLIDQFHHAGIPVVLTVHDVDPLFDHADGDGLGHVYEAVDQLIVHSAANRCALLERYPQLESKCRIVPHIALDWKIPVGATRFQARQSLGIPDNATVLLFFGTVRPYKGLDLLLDAYDQVRRSRPDLWLIVAGKLDDRKLLTALRWLGNRVVMNPRYIRSDAVWRYHLAADLAVFPYRRVSQSGALLTAMGFALSVLATNVGAFPETLDGNGWIVPAGDPSALASVLTNCVQDRRELARMGWCSRRLLVEHHAPERIADLTLDVYEELVCSGFCTSRTA